jgi:dCTP deaminase
MANAMILTGPQIEKEVSRGSIIIDPFTPQQVNPNSYNLRLCDTITIYDEPVLDPARENKTRRLVIPDDGLVLDRDLIYLGASVEVIGSREYVPILRARSSTARLGLFVHVTADLVDLGAIGQLTFQLHAVQRVRVYPHMEIGQVTFWKTLGDRIQYQGKYQDSVGPVPSRSYLDFAVDLRDWQLRGGQRHASESGDQHHDPT